MIEKIFRVDESFRERVKQYGPRDGINAIMLFAVIAGLIALWPTIASPEWMVGDIYQIGYILFRFGFIVIVAAFCAIENESPENIGCRKDRQSQMVISFLILAVLIFIRTPWKVLIEGADFIRGALSVKWFLLNFLEALVIAHSRELVFRGYIFTKLHGLLHKTWLVVVVTGLLYILISVPDLSYLEYMLTYNMSELVGIFMSHLVYAFVYMKTDCLHGVVLAGTLSGFLNSLVVQMYSGGYYY